MSLRPKRTLQDHSLEGLRLLGTGAQERSVGSTYMNRWSLKPQAWKKLLGERSQSWATGTDIREARDTKGESPPYFAGLQMVMPACAGPSGQGPPPSS